MFNSQSRFYYTIGFSQLIFYFIVQKLNYKIFLDGFRKLMQIDQGALKTENDNMVFAHSCFRQDSEHLLDQIKRKVNLSILIK